MGDDNPLRGAYLTCSNEIRRLVIPASVELNQGNSFIAAFYKISIKTVQRILNKFHLTEETDKLPRGGNKPFK
jgi:transposase